MLRQCKRLISISSLNKLSTKSSLPHRISHNYLRLQPISQEIQCHARMFASVTRKTKKEHDEESELKDKIKALDSDVFGTLSPNEDRADDDFTDPGDIEEENISKNPPNREAMLSRKQYADIIKDHLRYKRIKEAIDVMEVTMKEHGHRPVAYIYNLLIDGCAQVGYAQKAFQLFTRMRQRGCKPTGATYTSLFNACANGPYRKDSLEKAERLREIMLEKGVEPNNTHYNAMIKAFGRCGDLKTAFLLVDEMCDKEMPIMTETFNFLLQACASDKEYGFRHALLVWHKMYQSNIHPDVYSFNTILRCCRDTELGDLPTTKEIIQTILLRNPEKPKTFGDTKLIDGQSAHGELQFVDKPPSEEPSMPNLLAPKPYIGKMIDIAEVKKPEDRLILLGGFTGLLELMKQFEVKPDLKTYTLLIEIIPSTRAAENVLLRAIRKEKIKCDVDFFNILMKKRSMRFDYEGAKEVLGEMIRKANLKPDIMTYGMLALGCKTRDEAWELISEMNEKGIRMNMPILGAMVKQGCCTKDFEYILDILDIIRKFKLKPSEQLMETLDRFIVSCNYTKKKDQKNLPENFRRNVKIFKEELQKWKDAMGIGHVENTEEVKQILREKPWEQFQEAQAQGYEDPKNQKMQRKKKVQHHIKMIKAREEIKKKIEPVRVPLEQ